MPAEGEPRALRVETRLFDEAGARAIIASWKDWWEAQPLEAGVPKDRLVALVRRFSEEGAAEREVRPRIEKTFDAALERLRKLDRSAAALLGEQATAKVVEAIADLEPSDEAVKVFFEERAVGDLLGAVIYDGIVEFMRKANQISELVPGVQAAKKLGGFLGAALGGGLAGSIAGGVREEVEKRLEQQVRTFLQGFGRVAVERAVRFATAPANKKLFKEMRRNLARKALERPLKDAVASLTPERAAEVRERLVRAALDALAEERKTRKLEERIERYATEHGKDTVAEIAKRLFGGVLPTDDVARLLAPGLAQFAPSEEAKVAIKTAAVRLG